MKIIVTGSSGFIGGHLVQKLMDQGHHVTGIDIVPPKYFHPTNFIQEDLRYFTGRAFHADEVYNLACLMGGMGYIGNQEHAADIMIGSSMIVQNVIIACVGGKVGKLFYSSSACVYNMHKQETALDVSLKESDAYPAMPDLVYGWQKLFSEQMNAASGLNVRQARFHNIFGPQGIFDGGKEKAPAALCRKVAMAKDGDEIEVWGDGLQTRSFLYIDECLEGVERLMASEHTEPINIGSDESISINDLAKMIIDISGKDLRIKNISGPEGVRGRNSNNELIQEVLGWRPSKRLYDGIKKTYEWVSSQL